MLGYIITLGIAAIQIAVLTEPIVMVKRKDTSTRGASLASIQPSEESPINMLCESIARSADLFRAWANLDTSVVPPSPLAALPIVSRLL